MIPKYSPILWWPKKIYTKSSYPKNWSFFFSKTPKIIEIQNFEPQKWPEPTYVWKYCASVWNPNQKDLIQKMEMIQRRAARYVSDRFRNTSSVSSMLDALQWEPLESRRTKIQLTLLFKIKNDLVDIYKGWRLSYLLNRKNQTILL